MPTFTYEIHNMNVPLLPFRFRPFMDVTRRQSLPNWHEEPEILYCLEGAGFVQLGGERLPFEKGDTVIVNTRTPHFVDSDQTVRYCCLIVKNAFLTENGIDPAALHFDTRVHTPELQAALERVREVFAEYSKERFDSVLKIRSAVLALFCALCQKHASPTEGRERTDESVNLALTYLHSHFREDVTLDQISSHVGVSKFHLAREFKRSTGRTIMHTVMLLRLYEAKELIEKGSRISHAARSCGFSNLSYFTKCFQKQFQILPSRAAKKNSAENL